MKCFKNNVIEMQTKYGLHFGMNNLSDYWKTLNGSSE